MKKKRAGRVKLPKRCGRLNDQNWTESGTTGTNVVDYIQQTLNERGNTHGMSQAEYLEVFRELTETMYATTKAKNSDYTGDSSDPFKNFRAVEQMGVASAEQGFFTRMTDKIMRLGSFIRNGTLKVADEQIEDTLLDLATYCLLMICYLRDKNR